jgi:hypothetical protein
MRNYGLPASYYSKDSMGRQAGFEILIGGDVKVPELEERIILGLKKKIPNAKNYIKQILETKG